MKNKGKLNIIMVAVIAIGIFALPSVMSVGTGQHTFNNGSAVECNKCHNNAQDRIGLELKASGVTMYATSGAVIGDQIHKLDDVGAPATGTISSCVSCHYTAANPLDGSHTGVLMKPVCTTCHNNVLTEIGNVNEAHAGLAGGNAGCLGCHTKVTVTGSPSYVYSASVPKAGLIIGNGPVVP